jgi:hypothetical protein
MKPRTLLLITIVVAAIFGLAFIIVPASLAIVFGFVADIHFRFLGQLYGACILGIGVVCWYAMDAPRSELRTGIFRGLFLFNVVSLVVTLQAQLIGVMNVIGWSAVAVFLLFTAAWAYVLWARPAA